MAGFDDRGIFFSDNLPVHDDNQTNGGIANLQNAKKKFKEFILQFYTENFNYKYRDTLKRNYNIRKYYLMVNIEDLNSFNEGLADKLTKQPSEYLALFEEAAREVADELTAPRPEGEEEVEDIQIMLTSDAKPTNLRELKSEAISHLVKIPGIIVSASEIKAKATRITLKCRSCNHLLPNLPVKPGLEGYIMPRVCKGNSSEQVGDKNCLQDPYFVMPDKCKCVDFQTLRLQELPDGIPQSEIPRHVLLYCDRNLCDKVVPGNKVSVLGIFCIKKVTKPSRDPNARAGVRSSYVRVVGFQLSNEGLGVTSCSTVTAEEEDLFRRMAASPNIYEQLANSIAPSIYGCSDIKKAVTCLLFGGSRKRFPDGLTRRADIHILLLGDPGTAKSQLLKFVQNVSPIAVYTSGKGSSAAGLTASVMRDPSRRNFMIEGGAMVLADSGVVCIDEFDKMRKDDRVAIHEAMEQQTISIAKAGITTTLNTRCSVLAAANSIFGRWDESKGEENIDFLPTILSRFDMIFIVKDQHDKNRDMTLARHITSVHLNAGQETEDQKAGVLPLQLVKKYISYCRTRCGPRLNAEAADKLKRRYVLMRSGSSQQETDSQNTSGIPITVRQLEALIRISESLAKMQLLPFATEAHVNEALRLFQVSTLDAAHTGSLAGAEGFTTEEEYELLCRIEKQLKRRFAIGAQVSQQSIVNDFVQQQYPEQAITKVIVAMIRRGQLEYRMQRKMLYRIC